MTPKKTLNVAGRLMDLTEPKVMAILNVTPDSFYSSSRKHEERDILMHAERMLSEGATFLDVGGYSSRPGAEDISVTEEIKRVINPIQWLVREFPEAILSIDTFRSEVAAAALDEGAAIINDISAGHLDEKMIPFAGSRNVPYIAMHMRGTPQTMKTLTSYEDLMLELGLYFSKVVAKCRKAGLNDVLIDPGFGFSKTLEQNYDLLNNLTLLKQHDCPILVGLSRKSMIYRTLDTTPEGALNGTTVLNTLALQNGANILRVHDVKEAFETIKLVRQLHDTGI